MNKRREYVNQHDVSYADKLQRVSDDIKAGAIDRLTLAIGRNRYKASDSVTRRLQIDLVKTGLLVRVGNRFVVRRAA